MTEPGEAPLHRDVRDGVPVRWAEGSGDLTGALMFRVGFADESLILRGITHLVEHLALFGLGAKRPYAFNGFVDGNRTVFHARGTPEQVESFMNHVCSAIAALPLERLEAESRILRTETLSRSAGPVELMQWYRFGTRGHGLAVSHEYAFDAPNPAALRSWAAERFTAENAIAIFTGPIPAGVRLETLPHGRRIPSPEPIQIEEVRVPSVVNGMSGGVSMSFLNDRKNWIAISWSIVTQRLQERLRYQQGVSYAATCEYHPIAANTGHSTIFANCLDEHAKVVQAGLLEILDDYAEHGPTPEELTAVREDSVRQHSDPEALTAHLDSDAMNELMGAPIRSTRDLIDELNDMTPESCAATVRDALPTAILMLPPGCPRARRTFNSYPAWSSRTVAGRRFRSASQRFPWSKKAPELIVSTDGVSFVTPEGPALTVLYDSCAGAVSHPDGAVHLIGYDGCSVWIKASEWLCGERAREAVLVDVPRNRLLVIPAR